MVSGMQNDTSARTFVLTPIEARIVGALIEKALTTPEYYPLTLNALLAACNQRNNRAPIMALDERTVQQGLYGLQEKRLAECFSGATARVVKYRERLIAELELDPAERALICELLLRGPQTPGELRSRASRMHPFASLDEVMTTLQRLATREDGALVTELPRQPGHKETRFAHLLGDQPPALEKPDVTADPAPAAPASQQSQPDSPSRLDALEARVAALEEQLAALTAELS